MRLSPFDSFSWMAHLALGNVCFREGHYDDAALLLAQSAQGNPRFSALYLVQAAALALAGRIEESKSIARQALELEPGFRAQPFAGAFRKFVRPELVDGWIAGWRLAGLPE